MITKTQWDEYQAASYRDQQVLLKEYADLYPDGKTSVIVFDDIGAIKEVVTCPAYMAHAQGGGLNILEGSADQLKKYISDPLGSPALADRTLIPFTQNETQITADDTDELILSGIPDHVYIRFSDESPVDARAVPSGEDYIFTTPMQGVHTLILSSEIYLDTEVTVEGIA